MFFMPIGNPRWPPQAILASDWLISKKKFFSETALPNESKLGRSETRIACGGHVC
jgi:hypothetical protein